MPTNFNKLCPLSPQKYGKFSNPHFAKPSQSLRSPKGQIRLSPYLPGGNDSMLNDYESSCYSMFYTSRGYDTVAVRIVLCTFS